MKTITAGMTLGQIEELVGQPLVGSHTCTGNYYYVEVPTSLMHGQGLNVVIKTTRHRHDPLRGAFIELSHGDELCTGVSIQHWSKITYFNHQPWLFPLLALHDT